MIHILKFSGESWLDGTKAFCEEHEVLAKICPVEKSLKYQFVQFFLGFRAHFCNDFICTETDAGETKQNTA